MSYNDAQKSYVAARKKLPCQLDPLLMDMLALQVVWTDVEKLAVPSIRVLEQVLAESSSVGIKQIHLADGIKKAGWNKHGDAYLADPKASARFFNSMSKGIANSNLCKLELFNMPLNGHVKSCQILGDVIGNGLESIRFISLRSCKLGDSAFRALAPGLAANKSIQDLVLRDCALSDAVGGALCKIIRTHTMRRNDRRWAYSLRRTGGVNGTTCALPPPEVNKVALQGLLAVDVSSNHLCDQGACALSGVLAADEWLGAINLCDNEIGVQGIKALSSTVHESNQSIAVVDVRGNLPEANEIAMDLDEFLRERSKASGAGLLSRYFVNNSPDQSPTAVGVIVSAILRWQSGHQTSSDISGNLSSLAKGTEGNIEMDTFLRQLVVIRRKKVARKPSKRKPESQEPVARKEEEAAGVEEQVVSKATSKVRQKKTFEKRKGKAGGKKPGSRLMPGKGQKAASKGRETLETNASIETLETSIKEFKKVLENVANSASFEPNQTKEDVRDEITNAVADRLAKMWNQKR